MDDRGCVYPKPYFDELGARAGELETSMMMYLAPNLVSPLTEAGDGKAKKFKLAGLREGWAWAPREWTRVTVDTRVGNPPKAAAEKGRNSPMRLPRRLEHFSLLFRVPTWEK
ncbi:MAG: creatininase family protein [Gemmatimonadaceae bacterium]